MRIIQISAVYNIGSVGKIVRDVHTYLLSQNIDSYVLYGLGKDIDNSKRIIKSTSKVERYLSHIYYLLTGINFTCCYFGTRKIIRTIKRIKPDVIHIHCYNDYYINIHMLLRWLSKHNKRVMLTQHSEHYYTGSCGYALNCTKWKEKGCDSNCHFFEHHIKGYPLFDRSKTMWKRMYKSISKFNNNLTVVSCTPWLDRRMGESIILKNVRNHFVVYNGADNIIYRNYNNYKSEDKKIVLYVTPRFDDEIKGSKHINNVAHSFLNNKSVIFHIVGSVPDDFKLEKNIVKIGPLYGKELAEEYSRANVTIMLSKAECFPMVIVESLLCGTKVAGFKCGGPDDSFSKDMVTFVDWGNYEMLKNGIVEIINSNYDKNELAAKACRLYSKDVMAHNYMDLYKNKMKV